MPTDTSDAVRAYIINDRTTPCRRRVVGPPAFSADAKSARCEEPATGGERDGIARKSAFVGDARGCKRGFVFSSSGRDDALYARKRVQARSKRVYDTLHKATSVMRARPTPRDAYTTCLMPLPERI